MQVIELKVKRIVVTKAELVERSEWDNFATHYRLDEMGMRDCPDEEEFVLDPLDAMMFEIITKEQADEFEEFYDKQLRDGK